MTSEQAVKHMLGTGLRYVVDRGTKIKDISAETGLSASTIKKLMNEETEYPRFHTVFVILEYLGYEISIGINNAKNRRNMPLVRDIPSSAIKTEMHY